MFGSPALFHTVPLKDEHPLSDVQLYLEALYEKLSTDSEA